mmetsp:Transcript_19291/g.50141  ORF Transcript_19291/g.50141 Transcript_19291/m.50141 type:complete len:1172 (+) Transcript_19291:278-3793(+)|eukprot:CAMPEP_0182923556 /NCGR_PEP_ID=MMETSP0105_2-20130417/5508_1 /TAXON_ID=81532 ORGANISM="Acanthoeca-like sp., Strain 10tr" /NCGR_SAMPLE_ID=MMETSP0105_2 /ASSEMBLY_ACC=CAM_ASM_000205 /LENGTH=1171 /DNA_ID=CAMNT_0025061283 /DNA_START=269 /DNA_END=3784 /DNA_ORIENTATION=-
MRWGLLWAGVIGFGAIARSGGQTAAPTQPLTTCNATVASQYVRRANGACAECEALALASAQSYANASQPRPCPTQCEDASTEFYANLSVCRSLVSQAASLSSSRIQGTTPNGILERTVQRMTNSSVDGVQYHGAQYHNQALGPIRRHLNDTFGSLQLEPHVVIGDLPAAMTGQLLEPTLVLNFSMPTRNYSQNATIDMVDGAAGASESHLYVAFASGGTVTAIAPYPSSYNFLGPRIFAAGMIVSNGTASCVSSNASNIEVRYSLNIDAPEGFWVRADTGEVMISVRSIVGDVSVDLMASLPGIAPITIRTFRVRIQNRDIENPRNGPGNRPCFNGGVPVDFTEFDNSYSCNCATAGSFVGSNCQQRLALRATGVTNGMSMGMWTHRTRDWASEKPYIVEPPMVRRFSTQPDNITVSPTLLWWEITCNRTVNLTSNTTRVAVSTPPGVFIDTRTGRLSVSFSASQVNMSYRGCTLRVYQEGTDYEPGVVIRNMMFTVRDVDFGKPRIIVTAFSFLDFQPLLGSTVTSFQRANWTIGRAYSIPPVHVSVRLESNDGVNRSMPRGEEDEMQFVLGLESGTDNAVFFIRSDTGEITLTPSDFPQTTGLYQLRVTHPDFLPGVIANITLVALYADVDDRSDALGPGGTDCAQPQQRIDTVGSQYDLAYTCNCSIFGGEGPNCAINAASSGGDEDSTTSMTTSVIAAFAGLFALFAFVVLYQRRQVYLERIRPVDFEPLLQRLAGSGIVGKINKDEPPRELLRKNVVLEVEIGSGNFGAVWKGMWLDDKKGTGRFSRMSLSSQRIAVAVKTLKSNSPSGDDEFLREATVTWQFDHDNVVRMFGVVTSDVPYLLVLELCSNGELKSYLQNGDVKNTEHYALGRLFEFLVGIAEGMGHLIDRGFVHRDLAARNVLLGQDYIAKIADFGLGRETAEDSDYYTSNDANMLVPIRWTDPDVLGTGKFSEYTDVWAYGITAMEVFTRGATPYRGWLNTFVIEQTKAGYRMPCPDGCPEEVYKSVIFPCWLPTDEKASPRRPNFSIICAELKRVGAKIDPRNRKASTVSADTVAAAENLSRKRNRAYVPMQDQQGAHGSMDPQNDDYEYADEFNASTVDPQDEHYEYAHAVTAARRASDSQREARQDTSSGMVYNALLEQEMSFGFYGSSRSSSHGTGYIDTM